jgi:hypothetical protein
LAEEEILSSASFCLREAKAGECFGVGEWMLSFSSQKVSDLNVWKETVTLWGDSIARSDYQKTAVSPHSLTRSSLTRNLSPSDLSRLPHLPKGCSHRIVWRNPVDVLSKTTAEYFITLRKEKEHKKRGDENYRSETVSRAE